MRTFTILAGVVILALLPGCGTTRFGWLKKPEPGPPPGDVPTVAKLVEYLNNNAERIQSVAAQDIALTASMGSQSIGLSAQMVVQKPKSFRMGGKIGGKDVVDLGSNDQEFWFWSSQDPRPYQYYCSYKDWNEGGGRNVEFPFQPDWIIETLGMGPYGPPEKYTQEHDKETVRLIEKSVSPQGKSVRKVIVFQRRPKQPPNPQVSAYLLVDDATGKEICSAQIHEVQLDSARTNAILPRKMELSWPEKRIRLALKIDRPTVNNPPPAEVFVRRRLEGVPSFNMATGRVDPQIQPVQGVSFERRQ